MNTKFVLGLGLILGGFLLGLYVGVWGCFIGGCVDVVAAIKAPSFEAGVFAWGLFKIVFGSLFGWLSALFGIVPGKVLLDAS